MAAPTKSHVLFVDDDQAFLETAGQLLSARSGGRWQLHTANTPARALAILQNLPIDLVILDIQMPIVDGEQFLLLINRRFPQVRKAVLSGFATEEQRAACLGNGAEVCLEKPPSAEGYEGIFATLDALLALPQQEGFRGMLRQVSLPDIIQMECLGRNSSILEVRGNEGRGQIFIENGLIIHAQLGTATGEAAFHRILALRGGEFHLHPFQAPPRRTVEGQWESLLMEAARQRDEEPAQAEEAEGLAHQDDSARSVEPLATDPNVPSGPRQIAEFLLCSGEGEVLHQWHCDPLENRLRLLALVKEKARLLGRTLRLGEFDRVEMLQDQTRIVARITADRQMLVISNPAPLSP